jgi:hypothetical protein
MTILNMILENSVAAPLNQQFPAARTVRVLALFAQNIPYVNVVKTFAQGYLPRQVKRLG